MGFPLPTIAQTKTALLLLAPLVWVGCSAAPARPGFMADSARSSVTVSQLRAIDYEFASRFGQLVAACANQILESDDDKPATLREATRWRLAAAPQARIAAFNQDPLAGLVELWVLAGQQDEYFRVGLGSESLASRHACVVPTVEQLRSEAEDLAASVVGPERFPGFKSRVDGWVEAHPIEGTMSVRPTLQAELAALVGQDPPGGLKAVGSMEESLRDLNNRIAILSVQLPTETRWQADYLLHELFAEHIDTPSGQLIESMNDLSAFLEDFDSTLSAQTSALLDGINREREAVFASVEAARERILLSLDRSQASLVDAVDAQLDETVERFSEAGHDLIDHFFERLIGVLIGIAVFVFVLVLILIGSLRRRPEVRRQAAPDPQPGTDD